jgi:hypothetical protein
MDGYDLEYVVSLFSEIEPSLHFAKYLEDKLIDADCIGLWLKRFPRLHLVHLLPANLTRA